MFSNYIPDKTEDNRRDEMDSESESGSENESDTESSSVLIKQPGQHRSFTDVMKTMNTKFSYQDGKLSTALDVISWYLKGQKMIYLEAQSYCEFYLYRLMIPAIVISTITTVISGIFTGNILASQIVSGATALNTLILSLINYFKLDAKSEAHKMTAYSFDQLISDCEFTSGKILLSNITQKTEESQFDQQFFRDYICKIEGKIKEVKEKNQFIIPATIRERYPTVCNCNIFMDVLKKHIREMQECNELKVMYNDEVDIENQLLVKPFNQHLQSEKRRIYKERNDKICAIMKERIDDTEYSKHVLKELQAQGRRKGWIIY
jgi:hypothetical protein